MNLKTIDNDGYYHKALNALGYRISKKDTEKILQVIKFIDNRQGDITIKELTQLDKNVERH